MKNHPWPETIRPILVSLLIGGMAGVIGAALTTNELTDYAIELRSIPESERLIEERPRALPKNYEDALALLEERVFPAVGSLIQHEDVVQTGVSIFSSDTSVVILTSDGWMLTQGANVGDVVSFRAQSCEVDEVVSAMGGSASGGEEPRYGFAFAHCAIEYAPVVDFGDGYNLRAGDQVFIVSSGQGVAFTEVAMVQWGDVSRSSDIPTRRIILSGASVSVGSAVFNLLGELVGFVIDSDEAIVMIPFEHLSVAFQQVLESSDTISYPSLGVRGIDLARAVGVSEELSRGFHSGLLLYGSRSVEQGSAAAASGFLSGDIILSVEGVSIDDAYALDDVLPWYAPGDVVRVEIDRDGSMQELVATLGEMEF